MSPYRPGGIERYEPCPSRYHCVITHKGESVARVLRVLLLFFAFAAGLLAHTSAEAEAQASFWVSWEPRHSGTDRDLEGVHFADAQTGWAVGFGGTILATRNGGTSWEPQTSATDRDLFGVHFADAQTGWAVGAGGTILATRTGGASWEPQHSGTEKALVGVHFSDAQTGWAVGVDGTILATRNGGTSWDPQHSGAGKDLLGVHFADARTGWAVGNGGTILATRDGGTSWELQHSGTDKALWSVHFADAQTGWVVGAGGTMLWSAHIFTSPSVEVLAAPTTSGTGEVDLSFRIIEEHTAPVRRVLAEARAGDAPWAVIGKPATSPGPDGRWHVTWRPSSFHIDNGSPIDYRVVIDDGGPPLPPVSIGRFVFAPSGTPGQQAK